MVNEADNDKNQNIPIKVRSESGCMRGVMKLLSLLAFYFMGFHVQLLLTLIMTSEKPRWDI